jgi:hypothetical protein
VGLLSWGALSDGRTGLSFTIAAGPCPRSQTMFYCLRFETSLFVASYDSQGYGGGIDPASRWDTVILGTDHTENTASVIETCLPNDRLATIVARLAQKTVSPLFA